MDTSKSVYPLFVGLTRPPMFFGVTQTFFIFNFIPCMCFFMLSKEIILAAACFMLSHIVGLICCWQDPNIFNILAGKLSLPCRNLSYWGCNSYDPS